MTAKERQSTTERRRRFPPPTCPPATTTTLNLKLAGSYEMFLSLKWTEIDAERIPVMV